MLLYAKLGIDIDVTWTGQGGHEDEINKVCQCLSNTKVRNLIHLGLDVDVFSVITAVV